MKDLEKLSDNELLTLSLNGKRKEALSILYNKYFDEIYKYSLSLLKKTELSEDLAQEVFVQVFSNLDNFKPKSESSFKNYIFTIAHNKFINHYRKNSKHLVEYVDELPNSKYPILCDSPEEGFIKLENHGMLNSKISRLKSEYREIIKLRYFDELEYKEIAEEHNLSIGTVKSRLFKAHKELKDFYGK